MKKFLLLLHEDVEKMSNLSPKEMEEIGDAHMKWAMKLAESDCLISGDGLHENGILISGQDCIIKDGPYIESKEVIGGYYLLQADNIETAVQLCKECPCHLWGGTTEIREIAEMNDSDL